MNNQEHLDQERLVELRVTQSDVEANIIKSLLKAADIDCVLVSQVPHSVYPLTVNGLGAIKIKVLDSHLEAARAVIQEYESASPSEDLNSP